MKTDFILANRDERRMFKLTHNGKTLFFSRKTSLAHDNKDSITVLFESASSNEGMKKLFPNNAFGKILEILLKLVLYPFKILLSVLSAYTEISYFEPKSFFSQFDPFVERKLIRIDDPDEKTVKIFYRAPKYNDTTETYIKENDLHAEGEGVTVLESEAVFSPDKLRRAVKSKLTSIAAGIYLLLGFVVYVTLAPLISKISSFSGGAAKADIYSVIILGIILLGLAALGAWMAVVIRKTAKKCEKIVASHASEKN